ncbi:cAMP-binding protein - catabolite gene activator and regulatory subunit of cAMP-dependent protein kinase [Gynuella sunshinyii YC6258]|uniref:cAMP-binding protein-catabolite gene activator and regulatory subunit of cAMP-dependent protein kinase n=1 Tax=Gynuella sunshinyii YC6258 TaxID=1445510 RepID=A0A0C5V8B9_9GAMM|nr:cAMP-binding protein - catabolite gene activator and regulatory subunit of cAMP-dependent protein kinase [Gynuella sunshinyii YC6258]
MLSTSNSSQSPGQNHLLAALPDDVLDRLVPGLEYVHLPLGKVMYESGDTLRYAYFPTDSIVSLLYVMESGASAEISVVGNEGIIGTPLFMGGESTPSRAIVQSEGNAYRLPRHLFKAEFSRHSEMLILLLRYTQALITQMAQTAVCNHAWFAFYLYLNLIIHSQNAVRIFCYAACKFFSGAVFCCSLKNHPTRLSIDISRQTTGVLAPQQFRFYRRGNRCVVYNLTETTFF